MSDHPSIEQEQEKLARRLGQAKNLGPGPDREANVARVEAEIEAMQRTIEELDADQTSRVAEDDGFPCNPPARRQTNARFTQTVSGSIEAQPPT